MNVEVEVAEWLEASHADITAGENLFINSFPEGVEEGIIVGLNRYLQSYDCMTRANVQIYLFYRDYIKGRTFMQEIIDLLDSYRGLDADSWTVAGEIYADGLGRDVKNRNVFSVEFEIAYKEV